MRVFGQFGHLGAIGPLFVFNAPAASGAPAVRPHAGEVTAFEAAIAGAHTEENLSADREALVVAVTATPPWLATGAVEVSPAGEVDNDGVLPHTEATPDKPSARDEALAWAAQPVANRLSSVADRCCPPGVAPHDDAGADPGVHTPDDSPGPSTTESLRTAAAARLLPVDQPVDGGSVGERFKAEHGREVGGEPGGGAQGHQPVSREGYRPVAADLFGAAGKREPVVGGHDAGQLSQPVPRPTVQPAGGIFKHAEVQLGPGPASAASPEPFGSQPPEPFDAVRALRAGEGSVLPWTDQAIERAHEGGSGQRGPECGEPPPKPADVLAMHLSARVPVDSSPSHVTVVPLPLPDASGSVKTATPLVRVDVPLAQEVDATEALIQVMRWRPRGGAWEATVRLRPEHLGEVTLSVVVARNAVSAIVRADRADVRAWLLANEDRLRSGLFEHGLVLNRFHIERDPERRREREPEPSRPRRVRQPQADTPDFEIVV